MPRTNVVLTSKDEKEIKTGLATTRAVEKKLGDFGYGDGEKVGALAAALGDIQAACHRYLRLIGNLEDASYPETLADVLVELQGELEEISWHVKSIEEALPDAIDWLYDQNP